jgi:hypothetical protein
MMTAADQETLMVEMCRRWPGKFSDGDLRHWAQALVGFEVQTVLDVLTEYRNQDRRMPKLPAIREMLFRRLPPSAQRQNHKQNGSFADIIRSQNPHLAERSDAELIMRYHRRDWCIYHASMRDRSGVQAAIDARRDTIIGACTRDLWGLDGFDAQRAGRAAECVVADGRTFELAVDDVNGAVP